MNKIKKAAALIFSGKKLLIVKPKGKPNFINPGGKYKESESTEQCLKRELKEELNAKISSIKFHKTYEIEKAAHNPNPLILELYFVELENNEDKNENIENMNLYGEIETIK